MQSTPDRRLAAIVFTDIAGFTALSAEDEEKALSLIDQQRDLLTPIVEQFNGKWLKEMGDGLLLSFKSTKQAVNCAIEIQKATKSIEGLNLRIGIHQGDILEKDGDVFGDDVNIASRIEPFAAVGGVAISDKVNRDISGSPEITTKYIGNPKLKGVTQKVEIYCLTSHELPQTVLSEVSAKLEKKTSQWIKWTIPALIIIIGTAYLFLTELKAPRIGILSNEDIRSIAVLPLENLSNDPNQEYFVDGMTDVLISELSKISAIKVISRTSIMKYKGEREKSIPEIGRELNVDAVVEGTVLKIENRVRITAQLIHAPEDKHLWADSYDRDLSNVLLLHSEVAKAIANQIKIILSPEDNIRLVEGQQVNPEAYQLYLKGKHFSYLGNDKSAQKLLEKAVIIDPKLALAHTKLAFVYFALGHGGMDFDSARINMKQAVITAIALEDPPPEAYSYLALYRYLYEWDFAGAEEAFQQALALNPFNAVSLYEYSFFLLRTGHPYEAIQYAQVLYERDPLSADAVHVLGQAHFFDRHWEQSLQYFLEAQRLRPTDIWEPLWIRYAEFMVLYSQGKYEEAYAYFEEEEAANYSFFMYSKLKSLWILGKEAEVRDRLDTLVTQGWGDFMLVGGLYAEIGEREKALDLLEQAYEDSTYWLENPVTFGQ